VTNDWKYLTGLTQGQPFIVERIRLREGIAIEGQFEPPALARLTFDDQVFVSAFVRCHGSIREMEKYFGVSYPTIKTRLNRIAEQLEFVEIGTPEKISDKTTILSQLESGEISVKEALEKLKQ
jgi:hypothetical protein